MLKFKVIGEIIVSPLATSEEEFTQGLKKVINEWLRGNICNYQGGVSVELVGEKSTGNYEVLKFENDNYFKDGFYIFQVNPVTRHSIWHSGCYKTEAAAKKAAASLT